MTFGRGFLLYFAVCTLIALPLGAVAAYEVGTLMGYQMSFSLTSASFSTNGQAVTEQARIAILLAGPLTNMALCLLSLIVAYLNPSRMGIFVALSLGNNYARSVAEATSLFFGEPDPFDLDVVRAAALLRWPPWSLVLSLLPVYIIALLLATRIVRGNDWVKLIFLVSTLVIGLIINGTIHIIDPFVFQH